MSRVESVAESWEAYRQAVLPKNASPVQVQETRRAFYAGSYFMLMNVAHNVGEEDASEEEGIENLERLKAECEAFGASVGTPREAEGGYTFPNAPAAPALKGMAMPVEPPDVNYTVPDPLDMQATLKKLGSLIGEHLPDGWGFNLLLFTYGEGGSLFYISSAQRADVLNVMREFIRRQTQ